eukprot:2259905-Amphidinium_carterae.1
MIHQACQLTQSYCAALTICVCRAAPHGGLSPEESRIGCCLQGLAVGFATPLDSSSAKVIAQAAGWVMEGLIEGALGAACMAEGAQKKTVALAEAGQ